MPNDIQKRASVPVPSPADPAANVAELLSRLPTLAGDDYVTHVMELSEATERGYRAAHTVGVPAIGAAARTHR